MTATPATTATTATTATNEMHLPATSATVEREYAGIGRGIRDVIVMTRRNLVYIAREPMQLSDVTIQPVLFAIVAVTGLVVGWRTHTGVLSVIAGFAVALLFSYAVSWAVGCIGLVAKGPESGMSMAFIILFPLAFVSNAMVATQHMPTVLRTIANWNPVSALTAATRDLFGNPNPSSAIHVWPMQHPVAASLLWSLAILAVSVPLAIYLFRRRTTD